MSKKLIAVASAAALALTGLVGVAPANATAATVAYTAASGAGTLADPYVSPVPSANTIVASTNALGIVVSGVAAGDTVTVSISGTAKVAGDTVTAASTLVKVTDLGSSSLTKTVAGTANTSSFWVYQTSTAAASIVTVSISETDGGTKSNTTQTKYFKPSIGPAHNVTNIVAPATLANGADAEVTFQVTDVFGNVRGTTGDTIASALVSSTGATPANSGIATFDTNRKLFVSKVDSATNGPLVLTIAGAGADATNVGLGASNLTGNNVVVNNAGVSAQVATLTAQVAALQVIVDRKVTKKRFNTLARKWNAAFPSQKVKLKK
jgi:hypothetical protein